MAPFRFSLQQVLDYRTQLEDQAKVRFGKAQAEYLAAEKRLEELQVLLHEQERILYGDHPDVPDRWLHEQYAKGLRDDISSTSRLLQNLARAVEEARQELIRKAKDRKILDTFKDTQAQRHAHEERLQEQRNYDEIASIRFKAATF